MQPFITKSAHGKVILTGEHAVIYGQQAIACQLSSIVSVTLQMGRSTSYFFTQCITIFRKEYVISDQTELMFATKSEFPIGCGLGSSAATAYACFQALAEYYQKELSLTDYYELVQQSEQIVHKNPSGVDTYAAIHKGLFSFKKGNPNPTIIKINSVQNLHALLIQSGKPVETTGEMVQLVAEHIKVNKKLEKVIESIGVISSKLQDLLEHNTFDYSLIARNQSYLEQLGVVGNSATLIIKNIKQHGGVAKIVGAGGKKMGSGMILAFHPDKEMLVQLQQQYKHNSYTITISSLEG